MNSFNFVGLVLAGGKSSRMKTDKSYLKFQDKTLLDIAYNCLISSKVSPVFVSGKHESYTCIKDQWPESGPAAAILSVAFHPLTLQFNYLLVVPVDMPLLSSSVLVELMEYMSVSNSIEASFFKSHPLPCCIKISVLKKLVKNYQKQPNISMRKLLTEHLCSKEIESKIEYQKSFLNINTPSEFTDLRHIHET